jgi:hypothetical protein
MHQSADKERCRCSVHGANGAQASDAQASDLRARLFRLIVLFVRGVCVCVCVFVYVSWVGFGVGVPDPTPFEIFVPLGLTQPLVLENLEFVLSCYLLIVLLSVIH